MTLARCEIFTYLKNEFGIDACNIDDDTPLISSGIIDSLGVMSFVEFVSKTFGVVVSGSEVRLKHFDSVKKVLDFVNNKLKS